jgi:hypothetical protein
MCIDYTSLNKACPKDEYPLTRIYDIVNSTALCELLLFLDAYSGYYQIHCRDARLQPTIQPTEGMIRLTIGLGDRHLLLVVNHFRGGLLRHFCSSHVGRRCCRDIALRLKNTIILVDDKLIDDAIDLVSLTSHGVGSGSGTASSKWK